MVRRNASSDSLVLMTRLFRTRRLREHTRSHKSLVPQPATHLREDDNEEAVRKRLEIYHKHENQLVDFYRDNNTEIIELDASQQLSKVFEDFMQKLDE